MQCCIFAANKPCLYFWQQCRSKSVPAALNTVQTVTGQIEHTHTHMHTEDFNGLVINLWNMAELGGLVMTHCVRPQQQRQHLEVQASQGGNDKGQIFEWTKQKGPPKATKLVKHTVGDFKRHWQSMRCWFVPFAVSVSYQFCECQWARRISMH